MTILPVLLAGGSGTRLWPLSREQYPKQFLPLVNSRSLLQNTALRARALPNVAPPLIICSEPHRFIVSEQMREARIQNAVVMLEPEGRNTAPAAACAARWALNHYGPETIVFLMPADHVIANDAALLAASEAAAKAASQGQIVTFGIQPTGPETGFGYIKAGPDLPGVAGVRKIAAFVEKPPLAKAEAFLAEGGYYWNGGMFLFRADVFLDELKRLEPAMDAGCAEALRNAKIETDYVRLDPAAFKAVRNESIDYAVMERTGKAALVGLDAGWDDVGSWNFLATLPHDARGNVARGDAVLEDCDGTLVQASSRLVTAVGCKDMVVVETVDAVMVAPRERVQDVKKIVQSLKAQGRPEAVSRPRVYRPWGWYETIALSDRFQVKRILVKPGEKLSLQMHHHRAEHWVVVKGTARVTNGDQLLLLGEDESTYIPLGHSHRLENPGKVPLELIEVQSGSYLGEDDIVRFEDVYGRTEKAGMP